MALALTSLAVGATGLFPATPAHATACVTSTLPHGACTYTSDTDITGTSPRTITVDENEWSGSPAYKATLTANSPGSWNVSATVKSQQGAILAFPNTGFYMSGAVDSISSLPTSWAASLPASDKLAVGWSAYDLWFNNWADEVMIQVNIQVPADGSYDCTSMASATFAGQPWHLCVFGSERVWKPGTDDRHLINAASGTLDVQPMLTWMEAHSYLPSGSSWTAGSFGFEIASTGGIAAHFAVSAFTWHPRGSSPTGNPSPGSATPWIEADFSWSSTGAASYEVQVNSGTVTSPRAVVVDKSFSGTHAGPLRIGPPGKYTWRVRNAGGTWSARKVLTS
jgi:hypothetical protein